MVWPGMQSRCVGWEPIPADRKPVSQVVENRLQQARDAYHRHAWHEAFHLLREADSETSLPPGDLGYLAESAWLAGDPDVAIEARERAHARYLEQGDKCHAAEMALQLAQDRFSRLEAAVANGWLGRARRLLEQLHRVCGAWMAGTFARHFCAARNRWLGRSNPSGTAGARDRRTSR